MVKHEMKLLRLTRLLFDFLFMKNTLYTSEMHQETRSSHILRVHEHTGDFWHPTCASLAEELSLRWQRLGIV